MEVEKKPYNNNGVLTIPLSKDHVNHIGLEEDGIIVIKDETGKKGNFLTIWVKGR